MWRAALTWSAALIALTSCGGGSSSSAAKATTTSTSATTTTTVALSDAATTWCASSSHFTAIVQAATSLGIAPTAAVDEKNFRNPDGTRPTDQIQAAWERANNDPSNFPHYREPTGELAQVDLVIGSPWVWWSQAGWARVCNAAFQAR